MQTNTTINRKEVEEYPLFGGKLCKHLKIVYNFATGESYIKCDKYGYMIGNATEPRAVEVFVTVYCSRCFRMRNIKLKRLKRLLPL